MKKNKTSWVITGLGAAVTGIGSLVRGPLGSGLKGFGLAHILLGTLDMLDPRNVIKLLALTFFSSCYYLSSSIFLI